MKNSAKYECNRNLIARGTGKRDSTSFAGNHVLDVHVANAYSVLEIINLSLVRSGKTLVFFFHLVLMLVTRMLNDNIGIITITIVGVMAAADITVIQDGSAGELTNTSDMSLALSLELASPLPPTVSPGLP